MTATTSHAAPARSATTRRLGQVCIWAGLLGAASGLLLVYVPPAVSEQRYSYPLDTGPFVVLQVLFALQHLGLLAGVVGLWRTGAAGSGGVARIGYASAVIGMLILTVTEGVSVIAAEASTRSSLVDAFAVGYGISSTAIGIGLILTGVAVLRTRAWRARSRYIPLITGIYVFVPLAPALGGPFEIARLAIAVWMLLFAALGWAVAREPSATS